MGDKTGISWADATWNPVTGCTRVSEECSGCYAIRESNRKQHLSAYAGVVARNDQDRLDWTGVVRTLPERLDQPIRWDRPRRIFVNSMSDLWHPDVPEQFVAETFAVMAASPQHSFRILTKRPQLMHRMVNDRFYGLICAALKRFLDGDNRVMAAAAGRLASRDGWELPWPLPNVVLGTSIGVNRFAWRAEAIRQTPAAWRFLSLEPLLGPLPSLDLTGIDLIVIGGESGPEARPMHPDWARDLRDRALSYGVRVHLKQWGEWTPGRPAGFGGLSRADQARRMVTFQPDGTRYDPRRPETPNAPGMTTMYRAGKPAAGRLLDGRTWDDDIPLPGRAA